MRIVRFSAALVAFLAMLSSGAAASGFENSGIGAKARGMAGAFRAVADDWTAAFYNPAGYATIYDNQLGANSAMVHLRNELNPSYRYGGIYESGILNDRPNYNKHEVLSNPSTGFVARLPIWGETVMGLSAYQPFDYNVSWDLYDLPAAYNDSLTLPGNQFSNDLDVVAFQLTFAREFIEEKLSLGFGLQLLRADLLYTDIVFRDNPYPPLGERPMDKVTEWTHNDGNGWGFGLKAGMLMNVTDRINLGISASLPFDMTVSGTSKLEFFMPKNSTLILSTDSAEIKNPGTPGNLFISGVKVVDTADFKTKIKLPPSFGLGVSFAVTEDLTVALDAEYTLWSRYDGLEFNYSDHRGLTGAADTCAYVRDFLTADLSSPVDWDDAGKVMLGVSYDYREFTFVAGGSADQSPARKSAEITPQLLDTGDKYTVSGGLIVHIDRWDVGLVSSYTTFPDLSVPDLVDSDGDGLFDSFPGVYKADTYETVLSVNYRF